MTFVFSPETNHLCISKLNSGLFVLLPCSLKGHVVFAKLVIRFLRLVSMWKLWMFLITWLQEDWELQVDPAVWCTKAYLKKKFGALKKCLDIYICTHIFPLNPIVNKSCNIECCGNKMQISGLEKMRISRHSVNLSQNFHEDWRHF